MTKKSEANFWDARFSGKEYIYGEKPNVFFADRLDKYTPGRILLPAEGEGRNAVYAAVRDWKVTAFDSSTAGREKAMRLANLAGIHIDYQLKKASDFHADDTYDCVALVYAHFEGLERKSLFAELERSIGTGGHLIMEVFSKHQLGRNSGGPKSMELLYSVEEIKELFPKIEFSSLQEVETSLAEGSFHQGKAMVIRAEGTKKA